jgi:hypothetical protein
LSFHRLNYLSYHSLTSVNSSSIASLILSLPALPIASTALRLSNSDNLEHLISVKFFKPSRGNYFLVILFGKQQARLLQPFAIEIVGIFEYLTDCVNIYVLSEDVLTLSFDWLNIVSIAELKKFEYVFALDFDVIGIYVLQELVELVV